MFWLGGIVCDLILPGKVPHAFLDMIHSEGKRLSDELASNKKLNGRGGAVMLPMTSPANTKCSKPVFSSSDRSSCGRSGHVHFRGVCGENFFITAGRVCSVLSMVGHAFSRTVALGTCRGRQWALHPVLLFFRKVVAARFALLWANKPSFNGTDEDPGNTKERKEKTRRNKHTARERDGSSKARAIRSSLNS
jgi:hypothetical protein